jgi:hypothetical protein
MTIDEYMKSNPWMTYGYACGRLAGMAAAEVNQPFAGLSRSDWDSASDDYATGYRIGYRRVKETIGESSHGR